MNYVEEKILKKYSKPITCIVCHKPFLKNAHGNRRRFCSDRCCGRWYAKLPNKIQERKDKIEKRKSLLSPCLHCGHTDLRVINLHHINKLKYPELVMPLCYNCHMLYHREFGQRAVTETALEVLEALKKVSLK